MQHFHEFRLNPVGQFFNDRILLDSAYSDGLLHLDKFSHAIVVYSVNGLVSCCNVGINSVDLKGGVIETTGGNLSDNAEIFDIKPYFPCEDRAQNSVSPETVQSQIEALSTLMKVLLNQQA